MWLFPYGILSSSDILFARACGGALCRKDKEVLSSFKVDGKIDKEFVLLKTKP